MRGAIAAERVAASVLTDESVAVRIVVFCPITESVFTLESAAVLDHRDADRTALSVLREASVALRTKDKPLRTAASVLTDESATTRE